MIKPGDMYKIQPDIHFIALEKVKGTKKNTEFWEVFVMSWPGKATLEDYYIETACDKVD